MKDHIKIIDNISKDIIENYECIIERSKNNFDLISILKYDTKLNTELNYYLSYLTNFYSKSFVKKEFIEVMKKHCVLEISEKQTDYYVYENLSFELRIKIENTMNQIFRENTKFYINGKLLDDKFESVEEMVKKLKNYVPKNIDSTETKFIHISNSVYKKIEEQEKILLEIFKKKIEEDKSEKCLIVNF